MPTTTRELLAFVQQINFASPWSRQNAGGKKIFLGSPSTAIIKSLYDHLADFAEHVQEKCNIRELSEMSGSAESENRNISSYIPEPIRTNIIRDLHHRRVFLMDIRDINKKVQRRIKIHFVYEKLSNRFIQDALYKIYLWLSIVFSYASLNCGRELDIFIYFTEDEKKLPGAGTSIGASTGTGIIDREHVNTAFTTSCRPKIDIHIFRQEEWFKVFLHESFHCFGFDFSAMDSVAREFEDRMIKPHFGLNAGLDLRIYETYTETWANIIHILFFSYFSCNTKTKPNTWTNVFRQFEKSLKQEQIFSIFQCCKVLSYNGLSYKDVCNGSMEKYNENSNVFSYYILKSVLLVYADDFIEWCHYYHRGIGGVLTFQKTGGHIQRFYQFLIDMTCREEYIISVSKMEEWILANMNKKQYKKIRETMRMTVYG